MSVDIIEDAPPTLESIEFNSFNVHDPPEENPKSVRNSSLKKLILTATDFDMVNLEDWSEGLKSIINACPNLEVFKFETDDFPCDEDGALMDFCGLEKLQEIVINMGEAEYFTMNQADKQGRRWSTFDNVLDDNPPGDGCYVNLTWNGHPSVTLK